MKKLLLGLVPVCITFGPLFMTGVIGTASPQATTRVLMIGWIMLALGLDIMFRMIVQQQKLIEELRQSTPLGNAEQV